MTAPGGPTDMTDEQRQALFRAIPSLDALLADPAVGPLVAAHGREPVVAAGRAVLDDVRSEIAAAAALPGSPLLEEGTGRERSLRSDHQRRPGVTRRDGAGKSRKKALSPDISQDRDSGCSVPILPGPLTGVRSPLPGGPGS